MSRVVIIDYGMGNLGSVRRAFEECGANTIVTENPNDLREATHVVLPGVGAYTDGMNNIRLNCWDAAIQRAAVEERIPLLGICLGMQLLSSRGYEKGVTLGLNIIPGEVVKLVPTEGERIPHVGWNEVHQMGNSPLFLGILNAVDFYFSHSYHFKAHEPSHVSAITPFCNGFAASVQMGNVFGTQFHPEKSSLAGFKLIRNFLEYRS